MQTVHLSCTETNNVSKWTEARFHMTHVIKEFDRVHPNWFPSIWYVPWKPWTYLMCKPCTYLLPKLTLYLNEQKQDSIWHTSSRSYIRCVLVDFWAYHMFHANRVSILASRIALSPNRPNRAFTWAPWARCTIGRVQNGFLSYGALGANRAPILHRNKHCP